MKSEEEIRALLLKVEKLVKRIQVLKDPPDDYKLENYHYKVLLLQEGLYKYLLGDKGYDFDDYYNHFSNNLDLLENKC
jgi:hypothetical protein